MALTGSGELKFSQMRDEFGGSGQVKFSDLYRGGSLVRAKAGNNGATNLAASVPASGEIQVADFYSQAKGFRKTYSSGATNQDASSIFGDDYGVDYPKEIVINNGVELGATSTSQEALQVDSGLDGGLTITNNGTLTGAGGAAASAGGDAFQADVACTLINNGTIRAGGGGGGAGGAGGAGGTGGQGSTSSSSPGSFTGYYADGANPLSSRKSVDRYAVSAPHNIWYWNATILSGHTYSGYQYSTGGYDYESGSLWASGTFTNGSGATEAYYRYRIRRRQSSVTSYTYHNGGGGGGGGAGGAGGVGQGYNQSTGSGSGGSSGSSGSSGGSNAGSGGTGGTGGTGGSGGGYGAAGSSGATGNTGATGNNGNHTNGSGGSGGSGGSSGAAAGNYIRGLSNVTLTQSGTVQGGTV